MATTKRKHAVTLSDVDAERLEYIQEQLGIDRFGDVVRYLLEREVRRIREAEVKARQRENRETRSDDPVMQGIAKAQSNRDLARARKPDRRR